MTTKIAILSDVHGDLDALRDALERIDAMGCEEILCAGDLVDYGASPDEVVGELERRRVKTVAGNHDRWVASAARRGGSFETFGGAEPRSAATISILEELPAIRRLTREGVRLAVCHGAPGNDMTEVLPDRADLDWCGSLLDMAEADVLIVGHTHRPALIDVGSWGSIVNSGALLRSPVSNSWVGAPGTFGVLELPSRRFEVYEASMGPALDIVRVGAR